MRKLNYNRYSDTKTSWRSRPKLTGNQNLNSNSNWDAASRSSELRRIGAGAIFAHVSGQLFGNYD